MRQLDIDWNTVAEHRENSPENEAVLQSNLERLSKNCRTLYDALCRGERLTGVIIFQKYNMLEYRRRIKDLKKAGVEIKETQLSNGCKEWYMEL